MSVRITGVEQAHNANEGSSSAVLVATQVVLSSDGMSLKMSR